MTMRRTAPLFIVLLAMLMVLSALPTWAEDQPASNMDIVREKLRADKKLLVAENLGLTEPQAKAFWPIYDSYQKDLSKLGDRMIALIQGYAKDYETMTNESSKKLLDEYLDIEGDRQALRKSYLPKFRKILPETKVARYYQLEQKIHALVSFEMATQIPLVK
ncbi:MAG: hypothetical protein ACREIS_10070 [Nitrospiraceae bacterium]